MKRCPKCGASMEPKGTAYGTKWWECIICEEKTYLHDDHIEPCRCPDCSQKTSKEKDGK